VGSGEYRFATDALRASGYLSTVKTAIALLCLSMAALGWIVQFHPLGPHGVAIRVIHFAISSSAVVVGLLWLIGRWPSYRMAVLFLVWADLALGATTFLLSAPASRLCATIHMGLIGVFAAFLLGKQALAAHCVFATGLIAGLTAFSVVVDHVGWFDLYIFFAPALSTVVFLPVIIQAVIDGGRRAMRRTARDALHDPITGLHNRRGLYSAAQAGAFSRSSQTVVAAVIDLDKFKTLNDSRGHEYGDAALQTVASALRRCARSGDIVARLGGDEFVVVAILGSADGVPGFIERIRSALLAAAETITASVGVYVATQSHDQFGPEALDEVLRHADRAMYEAKRQGGNQLVHTQA
jgi:diguanylate cyclase (GGDEF)-like protein